MKEEEKRLINLIKKNSTVIVSCSGGPDSMALLSVINNIKEELNLKVIVAHVNHKVRKESDEEALMVETYAQKNNNIFELYEIKEYHEKVNFHEDARKIRYNFIKDLKEKYEADYIMTAHHGDDLIETILMRLTRGSNLKGYIGFKEVSNWEDILLIRPLINKTKKELEEYDKANGIPYRIDQTNYSDDYTRNRYRNNIIPLIKEEDKNLHLKYLKFSEEISRYYDYVHNDAIKSLNNIQDDENNIIVSKLLELPQLQIELIISDLIVSIQYNDYLPVTDNLFLDMMKTLKSNKTNSLINLPNGYVFGKEYDKLVFRKNNNNLSDFNVEFVDNFEDNNIIITKTNIYDKSNNAIALSYNEIKLPLIIRNKNNGDYMEVLNLNGKKKLSDIFTNSKISAERRKTYPILTDSNNNVLWIPGIKKSKFAKEKNEKYDIILICKEK